MLSNSILFGKVVRNYLVVTFSIITLLYPIGILKHSMDCIFFYVYLFGMFINLLFTLIVYLINNNQSGYRFTKFLLYFYIILSYPVAVFLLANEETLLLFCFLVVPGAWYVLVGNQNLKRNLFIFLSFYQYFYQLIS